MLCRVFLCVWRKPQKTKTPWTHRRARHVELVFQQLQHVFVQQMYSQKLTHSAAPCAEHGGRILLVSVKSHTWWMGLVRGRGWDREGGGRGLCQRYSSCGLPELGVMAELGRCVCAPVLQTGLCSDRPASVQHYLFDRSSQTRPIPNGSLIKIHLNSLYVQQKRNIFTCIFKSDLILGIDLLY